nr:LysR substrate-binding domain-containing protein [Xanthomonas theicola]
MDVGIRIRIEPQLHDGLVARCIAAVPFVFCAAPGYLARAGTPTTPEQLKGHACLPPACASPGVGCVRRAMICRRPRPAPHRARRRGASPS